MDRTRNVLVKIGKGLGVLGALAGIGAGIYLFSTTVLPYIDLASGGFSSEPGLEAENAPLLFVYSVLLALLSSTAAYLGLRQRLLPMWAISVLLFVVGLIAFSIGELILPAGTLLLLSAIVLTLGQRRNEENSTTLPQ